MSKRNYTIDTKTLNSLGKQADKVTAIQQKMVELKKQLDDIKENNHWLNYLGSNSTNSLTEEEERKLAKICETLNYANDLRSLI